MAFGNYPLCFLGTGAIYGNIGALVAYKEPNGPEPMKTTPPPYRMFFLWLVLALLPAPLLADEVDGQPVKHFNPNIELPDSEGKAVVLRACTKCHELAGLSAYKGYWSRDQWKELVESMVKNGAELVPDDVEVVSNYLARHFGRN